MKTRFRFTVCALGLWVFVGALLARLPAAEAEIENAFRDALYAEEVKGDLETALKAYQEVGAKFESQRDLAAAALFREGECLRKLGRKDEATAVYRKVLAQYGDKERTAKLCRENLAALGGSPPAPGATDAPAGVAEEEAKELARLTALAQNSPDLLAQGNLLSLRDAVQKGRAAVVAWLLDRLSKQTPDALGPHLRDASYLGHLKICELLADAGASVNGWGALHSALLQNRLAVARFLLSRKADVNEEFSISNSNTSLNLTWETGLRIGGRPQDSLTKLTPLMIAAGSAAPADFLSELLKVGAKVNAVAEVEVGVPPNPGARPEATEHLTALGGAIAVGNEEKVRLLLEAGADAKQSASDLGATPLLLALARASEKDPAAATDPIVRRLLALGADWKARLSTGATAVHITARRGLGGWLAEAIMADVEVNAVDNRGFTALHEAAESSSPEVVRTLVGAGAKPDIIATSPGYNATPLGLACLGKRSLRGLETVKALLEGGADPNLDGVPKTRPLSLALSDSFYSANCWPDAIKLLLQHGARPAEASIFGGQQTRGINTPLDDAALEAFRAAWKAAYWRDNTRLLHAVWLSQSESLLKAGETPTFKALLCDESAAGPPTLREAIGLADRSADWSKIALIRQKDGMEEAIPLDALAMAGDPDAKDFPLEWGDVLEAPTPPSTEAAEKLNRTMKAWLQNGARVDIRIQLDHQRSVANADGAKGPVVRIEGRSEAELATVLRNAGLTNLLFVTEGLRTTQPDGTLGPVELNGIVRHGDILILHAPEPKTKLSDGALRSGIWLCQNIDGPFWPVPTQQDLIEHPVPLGGLVAALLGPHSLPSAAFDWEKATVRFGLDGKEWQEKKLLEAWPELKLEPGTVVVLPPAERDSFEPPPELRDALSKALTVDWKLAIAQQPLISSHWEPRFFHGKKEDGAWVWRDLDPAKVGSPMVPILQDLLAAHPSAGDFKDGSKGGRLSFSTREGPAGNDDQIEGNATARWLSSSVVIHVAEADKAPSQSNAGRGAGSVPNKRRIVLPLPTNGSR